MTTVKLEIQKKSSFPCSLSLSIQKLCQQMRTRAKYSHSLDCCMDHVLVLIFFFGFNAPHSRDTLYYLPSCFGSIIFMKDFCMVKTKEEFQEKREKWHASLPFPILPLNIPCLKKWMWAMDFICLFSVLDIENVKPWTALINSALSYFFIYFPFTTSLDFVMYPDLALPPDTCLLLRYPDCNHL